MDERTNIDRKAIIKSLAHRPKPVPELARILSVSPKRLWVTIDQMTAEGRVQADKHAYYHLIGDDDETEPEETPDTRS